MRFLLTMKFGSGHDMEKLETTFTAPTFRDAAVWTERFRAQLGIRPGEAIEELGLDLPSTEEMERATIDYGDYLDSPNSASPTPPLRTRA